MKRTAFIAVLVCAGAALMAARPGSEFNLLTNLNGEEVRWVMVDGGPSGMYGTGQQCMPVAQLPAAANNVVEVVPTVPIVLCEKSTSAYLLSSSGTSLGYKWDGGCSGAIGDNNYGVPLQPWVSKFVVLRSSTTHLCQVTDGGTANTPVYSLQ